MAELGGYGLIDVNTLNTSIKASWVPRWQREKDWRDYPSYYATGEDVGKFEQKNFGVDFIPEIIGDIMSSWKTVMIEFYRYEGNILEAKAFENIALSRDIRTNGINNVFTRDRWREIRESWINCKIKDILSEDWQILEKLEIEQKMDCRIAFAEYFRLRAAIREISVLYNSEVGKPVELKKFVQGIKKGSGKIRTYLDGAKSNSFKIAKTINLPSVRTLWGQYLNEDDENLVRLNLKLWKIGKLNSGFKQFLFKFVHGKLYLNNVLNHIDNTPAYCTVCKLHLDKEPYAMGLDRNGPVYLNLVENLPRESVEHLFLECRYIRPVVANICNNKIRVGNYDEQSFMMGDMWTNSKEGITVRCLCFHYIKYQIYLCRATKRIPTQQHLDFELTRFLDEMNKNKLWAPFVRAMR